MLRTWATIHGARYVCDVARTAVEQASGLQSKRALANGEGMLFPFSAPQRTTFHMGNVAYPIDLAFLDGFGRVKRIVRGAAPGTSARWTETGIVAVFETEAGGLGRLAVGDPIDTPLTPVDFARFKDRMLPDESNPEARDQPIPGFIDQEGYDVKAPSSITTLDTESRYPTRPTAGRNQRAQAVGGQGAMEEAELAASLASAVPLNWQTDRLNGGATDSAVVTPASLWGAVRGAVQNGGEEMEVRSMLSSPRFLSLLGDALILAERADIVRAVNGGLAVWRGRA